MNKYNDRRKRRKAFLGAIISAVAAIGSAVASGIAANKRAKAQQNANQLQNEAQLKQNQLIEQTANRNAGIQTAANLTQSYNNAPELEQEFKDKFLRYGGRVKTKRRKAALGTSDISSIGNAVAGLTSAGFGIANAVQASKYLPVSAGQAIIQARPNSYSGRQVGEGDDASNYRNRSTKPTILGYRQARYGSKRCCS